MQSWAYKKAHISHAPSEHAVCVPLSEWALSRKAVNRKSKCVRARPSQPAQSPMPANTAHLQHSASQSELKSLHSALHTHPKVKH